MSKLSLWGLLLGTLAGTTALAEPGQELRQYLDTQCRQYAREDAVPEAELARYVRMCVDDLSGSHAKAAPKDALPSAPKPGDDALPPAPTPKPGPASKPGPAPTPAGKSASATRPTPR